MAWAPAFLLLVFVAWIVVGQLMWLRRDDHTPVWDEAYYLRMSLTYFDTFAHGGLRALETALATFDLVRPPLVPALTIPLTATLGRSADAAFGIYVVGFAVLALAVFGVGRHIKSAWCGLLAAIIVCGYPGVIGYSRIFVLDFGNTVLIATCLYFLVRSDSFARLPSSIGAGLLLGAACLTRPFSPIFLVGPFAVAAFVGWRSSRFSGRDRLKRMLSLVTAVVVTVDVAGSWYAPHLRGVAGRSWSAAYGAEAVAYGPARPWEPSALVSFFTSVVNTHLTLVALAALAVGALVAAARSRRAVRRTEGSLATHQIVMLLSAVVLPAIFFAVLRAQDMKNITPVLPAAAVLTAAGLSSIRTAKLRIVAVGLVTVWSMSQFSVASFRWPLIRHDVGVTLPGLPTLNAYRELVRAEPRHWPVSEILQRIEARGRVSGLTARVIVGIVGDHPFLNYANLEYSVERDRLDIRVERIGPENQAADFYHGQLGATDYVIVKTGEAGPAFMNPYTQMVNDYVRSSKEFREFDEGFPLPDGSFAFVYERLPERRGIEVGDG